MDTTLVFEAVQTLNREPEYLIALSGGADSVAALYAFTYLKLNVSACHVQHGDEPHRQQFATFCHELCEKLNVPFTLKKIKVNQTANWECHARAARYKALASINPDAVLVTGHHLDDQVETFFLKALRGSGIRGLKGMSTFGVNPEAPTQALVRPFLNLPKTALEEFLMLHEQTWIQDQTNFDSTMDRNFLRLDLLPQLEARWPNYRSSVAASMTALQADCQALEDSLPAQAMSLSHARTLSRAQLQAWVMNCFTRFGSGKCPSQAQLLEFVRQVQSDPTKNNSKYEIRSGNLRIVRAKSMLELEIV